VKRFWFLAGALVATLSILTLAFWLGSASFDVRRYRLHYQRLAKVMLEKPDSDRLTRGLEAEGTRLAATARSAPEKERLASERGKAMLAEVRDKAARYPELRVYEAGDMLYFIYFDEAGVMKDFTCVSR
jgi:hypothetical protein